MRISIIILNWNQCSRTVDCLEGLKNWNQIISSLWIVDNASTDQSRQEIPRRYPSANYLYSESNLGFAGGNNLAIQQILQKGDDYLLLLNNDASIFEDDMLKLLEVMENNPQIGILGPVLKEQKALSLGGKDIAWHFKTRILIKESAFDKASQKGILRFVDYVPGTVALMRTKMLHKVGVFDEYYFFSGEMADLCQRATNKGWVCSISTNARAIHHKDHVNLRETITHTYYDLRNRFLFIRKFRLKRKLLLFPFWLFYGISKIVLSLTQLRGEIARATYLALIDGFKGNYGNQNEKILN